MGFTPPCKLERSETCSTFLLRHQLNCNKYLPSFVFHRVNSNTNQPWFPLSTSAHSIPASCFNNRALGWLEFERIHIERPQWHNDHFRTKWQQWMVKGILLKKNSATDTVSCCWKEALQIASSQCHCLPTLTLNADFSQYISIGSHLQSIWNFAFLATTKMQNPKWVWFALLDSKSLMT